jgi:hypothetical protein
MVNYYNSSCPYSNCKLNCQDFNQHRARYASIRNDKIISKKPITKSNRINYDVLRKMQESRVLSLKSNQ